MAVLQRVKAATTTQATSLTATLPGLASPGSTIVALITVTSGSTAITMPAGWTQRQANTAQGHGTFVYDHVTTDVNDTSLVLSFPSGGAVIYLLELWGTTGFEVAATASGAGPSTSATASVTTTTTNSFLISFVAFATNVTVAEQSTWTLRDQHQLTGSTSPAFHNAYAEDVSSAAAFKSVSMSVPSVTAWEVIGVSYSMDPAQFTTVTTSTVAAGLAAAGSTSAVTWSNLANAQGTTTGTYATWTSAVSGASGSLHLSAYAFNSVLQVPGTIITGVSVTVRSYVSSTTDISAATAQLVEISASNGVGGVGSSQTLTRSTTTSNSQTFTYSASADMPSLSDLSQLGVRLVATHAANANNATFNVDSATITVTALVPTRPVSSLYDDLSTTTSPIWTTPGTITNGKASSTFTRAGGAAATWLREPLILDSTGLIIETSSGSGGAWNMVLKQNDSVGNGTGIQVGSTGAGQITGTAIPAFTYNATTMKYWRFRSSGTTIFMDYSADRTNWTTHSSKADTTTVFKNLQLAGDTGGTIDDLNLTPAPPSAAPTVVGTTSNYIFGTSLTVATPSGAAVGDQLLAWVNAAYNTPVTAAPAGWTLVGSLNQTSGSLGGWFYLYRKNAALASGELSASYTWTLASQNQWGAIIAVRGAAAGAPNAAGAFGTVVAAHSLTIPAITPTVADTLVLAFYSGRSNDATPRLYTQPTGMTEVLDRADNFSGIGIASLTGVASGVSTGTKVANRATGGTAPEWGGVLVALAPSASNAAPTANAGADQTVQQGQLVQLDGSASTDPESETLSYSWAVLGGAPLTTSDLYSDEAAAAVIARGPHNFWRMEETGGTAFADLGSGSDSALVTGAVTLAGDTFNGAPAPVFAGGRAVSSQSPYAPGMEDTISVWAKIDPGEWIQYMTVMGAGSNTWDIRFDGLQTMRCHRNTTATVRNIDITPPAPVDDGLWHHYAVVFNATTGSLRVFFDGALEASTTWAPGETPQVNGNTLTVGASAAAGGREFYGSIAQAAALPVALTDAQVAAIYAGGVASGATRAKPRFVAPNVSTDTTVTFDLTVTDTASNFDSDSVDILVQGYVGATLSGSGGLSTTQSANVVRAAGLSGSGSLSASFKSAVQASAPLSSTGTLYATGVPRWMRVTALSGSGTLSATPLGGFTRLAALSGSGALLADVFGRAYVFMSGSGTLNASLFRLATQHSVQLSSSGTLTTAQRLSMVRIAALSGTGTLVVASQTLGYTKFALLSGEGYLMTWTLSALRLGTRAPSTIRLGEDMPAAIYLGSVPVWRR